MPMLLNDFGVSSCVSYEVSAPMAPQNQPNTQTGQKLSNSIRPAGFRKGRRDARSVKGAGRVSARNYLGEMHSFAYPVHLDSNMAPRGPKIPEDSPNRPQDGCLGGGTLSGLGWFCWVLFGKGR